MASHHSYVSSPEHLVRMVKANPRILVSDMNWLYVRKHLWSPELFQLTPLELLDLDNHIQQDLRERMARSLVKALWERKERFMRPTLTHSKTPYPIDDATLIDYATLAQDINLPLDR